MSTLPTSNLPIPPVALDSSDSARKYFNTYYQQGYTVDSNTLDAAIAFFTGNGFDQTAAESITTVLISQAKAQKINVFQLIDTLKTLNGLELSIVVQEILNSNRLRISCLGSRFDNTKNLDFELRNVLP